MRRGESASGRAPVPIAHGRSVSTVPAPVRKATFRTPPVGKVAFRTRGRARGRRAGWRGPGRRGGCRWPGAGRRATASIRIAARNASKRASLLASRGHARATSRCRRVAASERTHTSRTGSPPSSATNRAHAGRSWIWVVNGPESNTGHACARISRATAAIPPYSCTLTCAVVPRTLALPGRSPGRRQRRGDEPAVHRVLVQQRRDGPQQVEQEIRDRGLPGRRAGPPQPTPSPAGPALPRGESRTGPGGLGARILRATEGVTRGPERVRHGAGGGKRQVRGRARPDRDPLPASRSPRLLPAARRVGGPAGRRPRARARPLPAAAGVRAAPTR